MEVAVVPERTLRVVWLDGLDPFPEVDGYNLVAMEGFDGLNAYSPMAKHVERLRSITQGAQCNLVVIGNNMGSGLELAAVVAGPMRPRTIIVFNNPPSERECQPYKKHGDFRYFCARDDVAQLIADVAATF
jgi:hypothetical protein